MSDIGTLYVLANRDNSLAKIGLTRNGTPDARATAYERAHGIMWHVYWSAFTSDVAAAEAAAHRELDGRRFMLVPGAREVFHCTPQHAVAVAQRYIAPTAGMHPHSRGERIAAAVLPIIATIPAARRLCRRLRIAARELHALLRPK